MAATSVGNGKLKVPQALPANPRKQKPSVTNSAPASLLTGIRSDPGALQSGQSEEERQARKLIDTLLMGKTIDQLGLILRQVGAPEEKKQRRIF